MSKYDIDEIEFKNHNPIDKQSIKATYAKKTNDTGSSQVQIALFVARIRYLTNEHFNKHKGDKHSRQGLLKCISKTKKQLRYLKRVDYEGYIKITQDLKIQKWLKN